MTKHLFIFRGGTWDSSRKFLIKPLKEPNHGVAWDFCYPYKRPYLFVILCRLAPRNTCVKRVFRGPSEFRAVRTWYSERVIQQFMRVCHWAGVTCLRYTVLLSLSKDETAVHYFDPALSVLAMLVSRNVLYVVFTFFCTSYVGSVCGMRSLAVCGFWRTFNHNARTLGDGVDKGHSLLRRGSLWENKWY